MKLAALLILILIWLLLRRRESRAMTTWRDALDATEDWQPDPWPDSLLRG